MKIHPGFRLARQYELKSIVNIFEHSVQQLCVQDYPLERIELWSKSVSIETFKPALLEKRLWVAEHEGAVVGFLTVAPGKIIHLFIAPNYVAKGIGRALAVLGVRLVGKDYSGAIFVTATLTAEGFYQQLGFRSIGSDQFEISPNLQISVVNMCYGSSCC